MSRRTAKPLIRRAQSDADVADAFVYYLAESPTAALGFVDALETAYQSIQRWPAAGSGR